MSAQQIRVAWIKGGAANCEILPPLPSRVFRLVLLGAPGVGKGTQAELLCERLGTCHLSTGDIFRAAKSLAESERSPALEAALGYMKRGDLVPDQTVLDLIRERITASTAAADSCSTGFRARSRRRRPSPKLWSRNKSRSTPC